MKNLFVIIMLAAISFPAFAAEVCEISSGKCLDIEDRFGEVMKLPGLTANKRGSDVVFTGANNIVHYAFTTKESPDYPSYYELAACERYTQIESRLYTGSGKFTDWIRGFETTGDQAAYLFQQDNKCKMAPEPPGTKRNGHLKDTPEEKAFWDCIHQGKDSKTCTELVPPNI